MNIPQGKSLVGLAGIAIWIWLRDLGWRSQTLSTIPILLSLAWYVWLVTPWQFRSSPSPLSQRTLTLAVPFLLVGVLTNLCIALAIGWTIAFKAWVDATCTDATRRQATRLLLLPLMAFPWMALDGDWVSTYFRLTAAGTAEWVFSLMAFSVERSGTALTIQGLPVSVDEACSGLGVLQAVMIAGVVLLDAVIPQSFRYWIQIPLLILIAWLANVARVLALACAALTWGPEFAAGPFHTWGGMSALVLVFGCAWLLIEWQSRWAKPEPNTEK